MELLIIEQQRRGLRRKAEDHVRALNDDSVRYEFEEHVGRAGLIDAMSVEFSIPFVTRALGRKHADSIRGAFEHGRAVGIGSAGLADVVCQNITDSG